MNIWRRIGTWLARTWEAGEIADAFNTDAMESFEPKHFQAGHKATARDQDQQTEALDWAHFEYFD